VAAEAKTHIDLDCADSNFHLRNVSVAGGAIDARPNVGSVVELDMGRGCETIDALPGHILAGIEIRCELLDLGAVCRQQLVAAHTQLVTRDAGNRPLLHPGVTDDAINPLREMFVVRKRDGLDRRSAPSEKLPHRIGDRRVLRGKDLSFRQGGIGDRCRF